MKGANLRLNSGWSAVDDRSISRTKRDLNSWLLTSEPSAFCLCKTFSCKACPGTSIHFNSLQFQLSNPKPGYTTGGSGRGGPRRGSGAGRIRAERDVDGTVRLGDNCPPYPSRHPVNRRPFVSVNPFNARHVRKLHFIYLHCTSLHVISLHFISIDFILFKYTESHLFTSLRFTPHHTTPHHMTQQDMTDVTWYDMTWHDVAEENKREEKRSEEKKREQNRREQDRT